MVILIDADGVLFGRDQRSPNTGCDWILRDTYRSEWDIKDECLEDCFLGYFNH